MEMNCELNLDELDDVTGGGIWDKIAAAIVAEVVHTVVTGGGGGFVQGVGNAVLVTMGRQPIL